MDCPVCGKLMMEMRPVGTVPPSGTVPSSSFGRTLVCASELQGLKPHVTSVVCLLSEADEAALQEADEAARKMLGGEDA